MKFKSCEKKIEGNKVIFELTFDEIVDTLVDKRLATVRASKIISAVVGE